jgi:hypothetical protein
MLTAGIIYVPTYRINGESEWPYIRWSGGDGGWEAVVTYSLSTVSVLAWNDWENQLKISGHPVKTETQTEQAYISRK